MISIQGVFDRRPPPPAGVAAAEDVDTAGAPDAGAIGACAADVVVPPTASGVSAAASWDTVRWAMASATDSPDPESTGAVAASGGAASAMARGRCRDDRAWERQAHTPDLWQVGTH